MSEENEIYLVADIQGMEARTPEQVAALQAAITLPSQNARIDRKINMGNYESLGIGVSVNVPIGMPEELKEIYNDMQREALREAYNLAAVEINKRVDRIKKRAEGSDD